MAPKDIHILIPGAYDCHLIGKGIGRCDWSGDYSGLYSGP